MQPSIQSDVVFPMVASDKAGKRHTAEALLPVVYDELRKLAAARLARESPGQSLQATALVHEAYLRLTRNSDSRQWDDCGHFFAAAAEAMRRILVERARQRASLRHGGKIHRQPLTEVTASSLDDDAELLSLDAALERLAKADAQAAEVVKLRYFGGLTMEQTASALGISTRAAYYAWQYARSWLRHDLGDADQSRQGYF